MRWSALALLVLALSIAGEEEGEMGKDRKPNRLIEEKSAYLRQHAHNPVDWYPWGAEAFEKAKKEDKPVFLSIGYSSCHWCHVMEHESFEDEKIAAYLNEHFVCVKVDREERPDVDEVYMNAAMAMMRGGGGWPLSVWLGPDKTPFAAGTYFPKEPKFGRPGFLQVLESVVEAWKDEETRGRIAAQGKQIARHIQEAVYDAEDPAPFGAGALEDARASAEMRVDPEYGGLGAPPQWAPKFPSPSSIEFLMRWARRHPDDGKARAMVRLTLDRMAKGGIHDHVGGGFHRYAVTRDWLVPHFEKMLYDNAQLLSLYAWAYLLFGDERYATTARDIAQWVAREMTHAQGGFYAAQDADDPGGPEGEGGFYVWDPQDLAALFPDEKERRAVALWFDVSDEGNWFVQGEQEKPGKSILQVTRTLEDVAKESGLEPAAVEALIARARAAMYEAREKRPKPMTDEKVLAGWNGLMISGLCKAYQALGDDAMLAAAVNAGAFLRQEMTHDGRLWRRWADGHAAHDAVAADHACVIAAYLDLYETTFDTAWLAAALALNAKTTELFHDAEQGGYWFTARDGEQLIARGKPGYDNARPSPNGVMAMNLLRIAELTGDLDHRAQAEKTLRFFGARQTAAPLGYAALLNAYDFLDSKPREIFIAGPLDDPATRAMVRAVWRHPNPNRVVAVVAPALEKLLPPAAGKTALDGRPTAYVCREQVCDAPVHSLGDGVLDR